MAGKSRLIFVPKPWFIGIADFRLTPWVSEVRAPLETLAFLGRSNLVEPDEAKRSPKAMARFLRMLKSAKFSISHHDLIYALKFGKDLFIPWFSFTCHDFVS